MIRADGWGATGREHESQGAPCQDRWALESVNGRAFACVSDGCSGAAESELGSLALSRAALALFREEADFLRSPADDLLRLILERAQRSAEALDFQLAQASATLLLLCHEEGSAQARVLFWGDGFAGRFRDGELSLIESASPFDMPFYPAYALAHASVQAWRSAGGSQSLVLDGPPTGISLTARPEGAGQEAWIDFAPHDLIFISTDGAARAGSLSARHALQEAGQIKSRAGRFLSRRMSRARQTWEGQAAKSQGRFDFGDDFSIAALLFDPDPKPALEAS